MICKYSLNYDPLKSESDTVLGAVIKSLQVEIALSRKKLIGRADKVTN